MEASDIQKPSYVVSLTRLRLRRLFDIRKFLALSNAAIQQAQADSECVAGATYFGPWLVFWTATVWKTEGAMLKYVRSDGHKTTMPFLATLCSEASTARTQQEFTDLPTQDHLLEIMLKSPKLFKVQHPSRPHATGKIPEKKPWGINIFKRSSTAE